MPAMVMPSITHEGIAFHDHPIGKRAAVAFVGVADDKFAVALRLRHRLPLDAGRKTGTAAAAQAGGGDVGEDRVRAEGERAFETAVAAVSAVVFHRARIGHAAAREGEAGLPLQPGNFIRNAEAQRMLAVAGNGIEQRSDVGHAHRTECNAARRCRDLDHRFQPIEAARAGPDDLDRHAARVSCLHQRECDIIGADRNGTGIERNEDAEVHRCTSASKASSRFSSSRPTTRPSSMADGAVAQRPRQ